MSAVPTYPALDARPLKDTICLFDVDETLTPARRVRSPLSAPITKLPHQLAIDPHVSAS